MVHLDLPADYGYVVLAQIGVAFTLQYLGGQVVAARKKYKVDLPNLYQAPDKPNATEFNCVQRGHQNALETYPTFLFFNVFAGLFHPVPSAVFAGIWAIGRILYMKGYATGKPDNRYSVGGGLHWIGFLGSIGLSGYVAVKLLGYL